MADKKEMTAQTASVGADAGQSLTNNCITIIPESHEEFNGESTFPKDFSEQFFDIGVRQSPRGVMNTRIFSYSEPSIFGKRNFAPSTET